jgi:hypothetical protein
VPYSSIRFSVALQLAAIVDVGSWLSATPGERFVKEAVKIVEWLVEEDVSRHC